MFPLAIPAAVIAATTLYNAYQSYLNSKYQKRTQERMFEREDNSIYRRVEDLRASGLSPVLAAGQGASAGPVVKTDAPQMDAGAASQMMALASMKADVARTEEQTKLAASQSKLALASAQQQNMMTAKESWDLSKWKERGLPTNASPIGKLLGDVYSSTQGGPIGSALNEIKSKLMSNDKKVTKEVKEEGKAGAMKGLTDEQKVEFERRLKKSQGGK